MSKFITLLYVLFFALAIQAHAQHGVGLTVSEQRVLEVGDFNLLWSGSNSGQITVQECDECEALRLKIDDNTLLEENGGPASIQKLVLHKGKLVVIRYSTETNLVSRISWYIR